MYMSNLSSEDKQIVDKFLNLHYAIQFDGKDSLWPYWMGVPVQKTTEDLWTYQEIIHSQKPDVIIETGTKYGGSTSYFASICDLIGNGKVISVDIEHLPYRPVNPRIEYITGSSTDNSIVEQIKSRIEPSNKVMVILDSDHTMAHVQSELEIYSKLVSVGQFLIVEDSDVNGHPITLRWETEDTPGPYEAIEKFLETNKNFRTIKERFLVTHNPNGYLRRIK